MHLREREQEDFADRDEAVNAYNQAKSKARFSS